jgi:hypothetical protein
MNEEMRILQIRDLENVSGGGFLNGFCAGIFAGSTIAGAGIALNLWNPVGWGGVVAGITIGTGCMVYSLSNS